MRDLTDLERRVIGECLRAAVEGPFFVWYCKEAEPENHYRFADALSCLHAGSLPRAKAHLERCLKLRPDHPKARHTLAEVERLLREQMEEGGADC